MGEKKAPAGMLRCFRAFKKSQNIKYHQLSITNSRKSNILSKYVEMCFKKNGGHFFGEKNAPAGILPVAQNLFKKNEILSKMGRRGSYRAHTLGK